MRARPALVLISGTEALTSAAEYGPESHPSVFIINDHPTELAMRITAGNDDEGRTVFSEVKLPVARKYGSLGRNPQPTAKKQH